MMRPLASALWLLLAGGSTAWAAEPPLVSPPPTQALVQPQPTLEERLGQLEQQVRNQPLLELLARLDALQQENQQLRGELEEQGHLLKELKQQFADSYRDLDRRMLQLERTGATAPAAANGEGSAETATDNAERDGYQAAFDMLRELRYDQAAEAFAAFLKSHPNGRYAAMAQYWLAEAHYARRDFPRAIAEYQALASRFPDSAKLPEALLKSGYSQLELNKKGEAQQAFEEVVKRFPQSAEAQQAQSSLKSLAESAAAKGSKK